MAAVTPGGGGGGGCGGGGGGGALWRAAALMPAALLPQGPRPAGARPTYATLIPNGARVPCPAGVTGCAEGDASLGEPATVCRGVGHATCIGGTMPPNPFGRALYAAGLQWTQELCEADSDGDGAANGAELGDPCCVWTPGAEPQAGPASHPGFPGSAPAAGAAAVECAGQTPAPPTPSPWVDTFYAPGEEQLTQDFHMKPYTIPEAETTYTNFLFHFTPSGCSPEGCHLVGLSPLIANGTLELVHHIEVYGCTHAVSEASHGLPQYFGFLACPNGNIAFWTPGRDVMFRIPPEASLPMNGEANPWGVRDRETGEGLPLKGFAMQVHYNNPGHVAGVQDTTGFRVHYIPQPRANILGKFGAIILTAHPNLYVPPRRRRWFISGSCKVQGLRGREVHAAFGWTHMHLTGVEAYVDVFRGGALHARLVSIPAWTYDDQTDVPILHRGITLRDGDRIQGTCVYDTTRRARATPVGRSTEDEMCFTIVSVFPVDTGSVCVRPTTDEAKYLTGDISPGTAYSAWRGGSMPPPGRPPLPDCGAERAGAAATACLPGAADPADCCAMLGGLPLFCRCDAVFRLGLGYWQERDLEYHEERCGVEACAAAPATPSPTPAHAATAGPTAARVAVGSASGGGDSPLGGKEVIGIITGFSVVLMCCTGFAFYSWGARKGYYRVPWSPRNAGRAPRAPQPARERAGYAGGDAGSAAGDAPAADRLQVRQGQRRSFTPMGVLNLEVEQKPAFSSPGKGRGPLSSGENSDVANSEAPINAHAPTLSPGSRARLKAPAMSPATSNPLDPAHKNGATIGSVQHAVLVAKVTESFTPPSQQLAPLPSPGRRMVSIQDATVGPAAHSFQEASQSQFQLGAHLGSATLPVTGSGHVPASATAGRTPGLVVQSVTQTPMKDAVAGHKAASSLPGPPMPAMSIQQQGNQDRDMTGSAPVDASGTLHASPDASISFDDGLGGGTPPISPRRINTGRSKDSPKGSLHGAGDFHASPLAGRPDSFIKLSSPRSRRQSGSPSVQMVICAEPKKSANDPLDF